MVVVKTCANSLSSILKKPLHIERGITVLLYNSYTVIFDILCFLLRHVINQRIVLILFFPHIRNDFLGVKLLRTCCRTCFI